MPRASSLIPARSSLIPQGFSIMPAGPSLILAASSLILRASSLIPRGIFIHPGSIDPRTILKDAGNIFIDFRAGKSSCMSGRMTDAATPASSPRPRPVRSGSGTGPAFRAAVGAGAGGRSRRFREEPLLRRAIGERGFGSAAQTTARGRTAVAAAACRCGASLRPVRPAAGAIRRGVEAAARGQARRDAVLKDAQRRVAPVVRPFNKRTGGWCNARPSSGLMS